jgi:hypothetical protein
VYSPDGRVIKSYRITITMAFEDIDSLREKLRKVEALFAGASTKGEGAGNVTPR